MKKYLFLLLVLIPFNCWGATYNYYFSSSGNDSTGVGTEASPWATLSKLNTEIDALASTDTVNAYFKRGDTWTWNSAAVSTSDYKLQITSSNPVVHIDAYGTGNKPIFSGLVTDFSSVPEHDTGTGPHKWNRFFDIRQNDCSIKNVEITGVYGNAIYLYEVTGTEVSHCDFNNFGSSAVAVATGLVEDSEIAYNTIHTGQQLFLNEKTTGWGGALKMTSTTSDDNRNNWVHHNIIYDISGEGINTINSVVEYNIIGDTCSTGVTLSTHDNDAYTGIIRYNLVTFSDISTSDYTHCSFGTGSGDPVGLRIYDDVVGGDNSSADFQIYGNTVINRYEGIKFFSPEDSGNPFGKISIYNNTVIDSSKRNYYFGQAEEITSGYFYNNSSIFYDREGTEPHIEDNGSFPVAGMLESNNHYYSTGGTHAIDSDWDTNAVLTDPKLSGDGTVDWTTQTGSTYFSDIKFSDIIPTNGSSLIDSGKTLGTGFENEFLKTGTDFTGLPDGGTFDLEAQGTWDIGAAILSSSTVTTMSIGIGVSVR